MPWTMFREFRGQAGGRECHECTQRILFAPGTFVEVGDGLQRYGDPPGGQFLLAQVPGWDEVSRGSCVAC